MDKVLNTNQSLEMFHFAPIQRPALKAQHLVTQIGVATAAAATVAADPRK